MARTKAQKEQIAIVSRELMALTGAFCDQHLSAECGELAAKLIRKMGRKREVPFLYGRLETWAAAIVYALCQINYLFDPKAEAHTTPNEIADYFGVGRKYVGVKAKVVRDMFRLRPWDEEFSTQELRDADPAKKVLMVDGQPVPDHPLNPFMHAFLRKYWRRR